MSKFSKAYNNFSGGKVSDTFRGRFDLPLYDNSLEEFKNFFMGKIGGAYKRTGSVLVHDLTNVSAGFTDTHTPIPFDTGKGSSYTLYLPNAKVKIDTGASNEVHLILNDGNGLTSPTEYGIGGGITHRVMTPVWPSTIGTPFTEGHWVWQQVGDLLFLTHTSGEQRPLVLARTSPTTFDINYYDTYLTEFENFPQGFKVPYFKNRGSRTMTFNSGAGTMTASSNYFTANMVGAWIRINIGGVSGLYLITAYTSATVVSVSLRDGASTGHSTVATDDWEISAWNDEWGWPIAVAYHKQRLYWGGCKNKNTDYIWVSLLGNLFHMMRERLDQDQGSTDTSGNNFFGDPVLGVDPSDFRPASNQSNAVNWLAGGRVLMSGTTGGENLINMGVEEISILENTNYGSSPNRVVKAGKDLIFVGKDNRSLRTYRYSEENGSWLSDDLTSKAETLFLDGAIGALDFPTIKQLAWNPDTKQLWCVLSDFKVKVLSYDPEWGLNGWQDFEIGGETVLNVLGVHTLPSPDRKRYETYLTVARRMEGAGATKIYLEKVMGAWNNTSVLTYSSTDIYDFPRFLDFAQLATANGSGVVGSLNLNYQGNTFDCVWVTSSAFGYQLGVTVNGSNELDYTFPANAKVIYGYAYDAELKTLPPEAGGQYGTAQADIKHIHETYMKLYRSKDFSIGSKDKRSGVELSFETVSYDDLKTDDVTIQPADNPDTEGQIIIRNNLPTPLNILAIVNKGVSYD